MFCLLYFCRTLPNGRVSFRRRASFTVAASFFCTALNFCFFAFFAGREPLLIGSRACTLHFACMSGSTDGETTGPRPRALCAAPSRLHSRTSSVYDPVIGSTGGPPQQEEAALGEGPWPRAAAPRRRGSALRGHPPRGLLIATPYRAAAPPRPRGASAPRLRCGVSAPAGRSTSVIPTHWFALPIHRQDSCSVLCLSRRTEPLLIGSVSFARAARALASPWPHHASLRGEICGASPRVLS